MDFMRYVYRGFTTHLTNKFNTERQSNRPIATTVRVARLSVLWYNEDIHKAKRLRRKAERTWTTFLAAAQKMWNSLPVNIRNEENFDTFKTLLKTFFKLAFY